MNTRTETQETREYPPTDLSPGPESVSGLKISKTIPGVYPVFNKQQQP
jgi:hypothetical protein